MASQQQLHLAAINGLLFGSIIIVLACATVAHDIRPMDEVGAEPFSSLL